MTVGTDPTPYRFRRLLALYPARWQAEHAEAYLGVMLDVAEAESRARSTARERFSVLRHLAAVWRDELGRRAAADKGLASLRWLGPAALVSGTVLALLATVLGEWGPLPHGRVRYWEHGGTSTDHRAGVLTTGIVLYALWFLAFGLAAGGRGRAARRVLAVCAVVPAALVGVAATTPLDRPLLGELLPFTAFAVLASVAWPVGATRRTRWWTVGTAVVLGLAGIARVLVEVLRLPSDGRPEQLLGNGFYGGPALALLDVPVVVAVLGACTVGLVALGRRPGVLLTATLVGAPWLVLVQVWIPMFDSPTGWWLLHRSPPFLAMVLAVVAAPLTAAAGSAALRAARAG